MNNTKSISNSPKDSVICKTAFQLIPSLTRACTMDAAGAGEGVWRLDDALGAGSEKESSFIQFFPCVLRAGRSQLFLSHYSCDFKQHQIFSSSSYAVLNFYLLLANHSRKYYSLSHGFVQVFMQEIFVSHRFCNVSVLFYLLNW